MTMKPGTATTISRMEAALENRASPLLLIQEVCHREGGSARLKEHTKTSRAPNKGVNPDGKRPRRHCARSDREAGNRHWSEQRSRVRAGPAAVRGRRGCRDGDSQ